MKKIFFITLTIALLAGLLSCNKNEGEGGSASIEGNVFIVNHPDDNYNLETDTIVAAKTDVFIVYGNETYFGDDVETDATGHYKFKYLNKGNYTVYAYSILATGEKIAVSKSVSVKNGESCKVEDIYVHEGKAYGTSMIKGSVMATYFNKDLDTWTGWAYEHRVYIKVPDQPYHFSDARVGIDGVYMFQKLQPGDYVIFTTSQNANEVPFIVSDSVNIPCADTIIEVPQIQVQIKV